MDISDLNEMNYKIDAVIDYLKNNNGYEYKLYNHDPEAKEPDSNIVEYAQDVKALINSQLNSAEVELPF